MNLHVIFSQSFMADLESRVPNSCMQKTSGLPQITRTGLHMGQSARLTGQDCALALRTGLCAQPMHVQALKSMGPPVLSKIQCVSHTGIFSLPHRQTCLPHLFCRLLPVSFHKRWRNHRPFDKLYTPGFGWCLCLVVPYEGLHREIITTRFSTKSSSMQSGPTRSPLGCCLLDLIWSCAYS